MQVLPGYLKVLLLSATKTLAPFSANRTNNMTQIFETPSPTDEAALPLAWNAQRLPRTLSITNDSFIDGVFPSPPMGARVVVCSLVGDPDEAQYWTARRRETASDTGSENHNNYVNCSTFRPNHEGAIRAQKESFAACHALLLDDLGGKIPVERVQHFTFSWVIETSPGNFQAGIILDPPVTDADEASRVHNGLIAAGLCDPGAKGPATRWVRLPVGINGKPEHRRDDQPFRCQLRAWNPTARYSLQEIATSFQLGELPPARLTASAAEATDEDNRLRRTVKELEALLSVIDPDCPYGEWFNVILALYHETDGSEAGLELADSWSSNGQKYKGRKEIEAKWRSIRPDADRPVTLATLLKMVKDAGADWMTLIDEAGPQFELCETIINEIPGPASQGAPPALALAKYSLRHRLAELERNMVEQRPLLGEIALLGQATAIYAMPNTGKTLITLALIVDAIEQKRVDPAKVFYINMDDHSKGLVEKTRLAHEYGFEMIADGHEEFRAATLLDAMSHMTDTDTAAGVVLVLDTLKKFVDTMHKTSTAGYNKFIRRFVLKGGTVIALAHTNKNPGKDGEPVYSGTTDVVDDFDCAYTVKALEGAPSAREKVVQFKNLKRRGNVPHTAAYRYAWERDISYANLLMSVEPVAVEDLDPLIVASEQQSDGVIISAIESSIRAGINTKIKIVVDAAEKTKASRRTVSAVLEKYTGPDPSLHRWQYAKGDRGAHIHVLLESPLVEANLTG